VDPQYTERLEQYFLANEVTAKRQKAAGNISQRVWLENIRINSRFTIAKETG
jgi:hypothetical protein